MDPERSTVSLAVLESMLNCSVCFKIMKPRIFQCKNGHTLCEDCNSKVEKCPTCKCSAMGRCLFAEQLSTKIPHSCSYAGAGCEIKLQYEELQDHENICAHRPFKCPFYYKSNDGKSDDDKSDDDESDDDESDNKCDWYKPLLQFEHHVRSKHYKVCKTGPVITCFIYGTLTDITDHKNVEWEEHILSAFEKLFWFRFRLDQKERTHLLSVQHVGQQSDTEEFEYVVTCTFPNNKMKISFESEVHSFAEPYEDIFKSKHCFVLPNKIIEAFITDSPYWIIVEIKKHCNATMSMKPATAFISILVLLPCQVFPFL